MGLKILIGQAGFKNIKIDHGFNGQEAINKVDQAYRCGYSYGLIFMDASMPIVDGYQATEEIRNFVRIKNIFQPMVIAVTGHTEPEFI